MNEQTIAYVYEKLGDEISKKIFADRLMYSITKDGRWIFDIIRTSNEGKEFLHILDCCSKHGESVIFGTGIWGRKLKQITEGYSWKCFIDNTPTNQCCEGIPVIKCSDFLEFYAGEYVWISSRLYYKEMYNQLLEGGINPERIINFGKLADELTCKQYFDLEQLVPSSDKEIFVDAGSFDGMSSVYFSDWCHGRSYVYAFEPDQKNIQICEDNLATHGIEHRLFSKGLWECDTTLYFAKQGNALSHIDESGIDMVEVVSLDSVLRDKPVTFIKMDIEGSEKQALRGGINLIRRNKPKLAISVYHRPEDIWEIPEMILEINKNYTFYLRHYSLSEWDTVLYAVE